MVASATRLTWTEFLNIVTSPSPGLGKRIDRDPEQLAAVREPVASCLHLVAGPGTGKTTTLTLRLLKLVFVDGVPPAGILATTFTKKAAAELRSRMLGWGDQLRKAIAINGQIPKAELERLDLNQVTTGTLDSVAENVMTEFRTAGIDTLTPVEDFIASAYMRTAGLFPGGRFKDPVLRAYVGYLQGTAFGINMRTLIEVSREVRDRFLHDMIDVNAYVANRMPTHPGVGLCVAAIQGYEKVLAERLLTDFAGIEAEFLTRLGRKTLARFTDQLQVVLVDEYQDTNLLQELIYFELARNAIGQGGSITVVGDDDQSLYRFRGATVALFTGFPARLMGATSAAATTIPLSRNYRSTQTVVGWANDFITLDTGYQTVRSASKPSLQVGRGAAIDYPVLGMFRATRQELADDLCAFLEAVFRSGGFHLAGSGGLVIQPSTGGGPADCAILCSSPRDYDSNGNPRLPFLVRTGLERLTPPLRIFNPRGEDFTAVQLVRQLLGLLLECIDPGRRLQASIAAMSRDIVRTLDDWRAAAQSYIATDPLAPGATSKMTLLHFVQNWQQRPGKRWPRSVPFMQLLYELITWIPAAQTDPEGLLYLEAITRTAAAAEGVGAFRCNVFRDSPYADPSVRELIRGVFEPLASGEAEIDEDLMMSFPSDRIPILSVHQAKGLEFPLTIVDVGSDFRTDHHSQAFKRFPRQGGRPQRMEDELWPFSSGLSAPSRSGRDRAFDDLIRQYFVAFTRAQDVLLLAGLGDDHNGTWKPRAIPNVALGYVRDGSWPWEMNSRMTLL